MNAHGHLATRAQPVRLIWLLACLLLSLSGCMNLSGLGGSSDYACKAPDGVTCTSVSGTYANAVQDNLPAQVAKRRMAAKSNGEPGTNPAPGPPQPRLAPARASAKATVPPVAQSPSLALPLRSSARILRLWFKPWEDADRDLYDQGYVYVQIDAGQWLIDHAQRQIRDAYAPIRPPMRAPVKPATPEQSTSPGRPVGQQRQSPYTPDNPDTGPLLPPIDSPDPSN
jgi:conjugal transfer pilus assembly protein TraV